MTKKNISSILQHQYWVCVLIINKNNIVEGLKHHLPEVT